MLTKYRPKEPEAPFGAAPANMAGFATLRCKGQRHSQSLDLLAYLYWFLTVLDWYPLLIHNPPHCVERRSVRRPAAPVRGSRPSPRPLCPRPAPGATHPPPAACHPSHRPIAPGTVPGTILLFFLCCFFSARSFFKLKAPFLHSWDFNCICV